MIIKQIKIENFRAIKDETLCCDNLTALVGANNSGKSTFLNAISIFQDNALVITEDDYYNKDTTKDITIAITFKDLSDEAKDQFRSYIQNDELTVVRIIKWNGGKYSSKIHGLKFQNKDFIEIYNSLPAQAKIKYAELLHKYEDFPQWKSYPKTKEYLEQWESENRSSLEWLPDDGQFFGYKEVGSSYLSRFIRFLHIPAVYDATKDGSEGRGSWLTELINLVIRNKFAEMDTIKTLRDNFQKEYHKVVSSDELKKQLGGIETEMTGTLQEFVPNAEINLSWASLTDFKINPPEVDLSLREDNYASPLTFMGHGLQRSLVLTLLQHLSAARINSTNDNQKQYDMSPSFVLLIEEPELYQHPNRQRHLASVLSKLSDGGIPGVSSRTQIIYTTHSPHFVSIDRIDQIRLLRKINADCDPKITRISSTNIKHVHKKMSELNPDWNMGTHQDSLLRFHTIITPFMNEGFFADLIVLVEGEGDRMAILAAAESMGIMLESSGISIIPCQGKPNIVQPALLFTAFSIPVYVIWDLDSGSRDDNPIFNHTLLSLVGASQKNLSSLAIKKRYACFKTDMLEQVKEEIGITDYDKYVDKFKNKFFITIKPHKHPVVIYNVIKNANQNKQRTKTLERIVQNILDLKKSAMKS